MAKIIKTYDWAKKKDPQKGRKLQILANRMFMAKDLGSKYTKIRRAAEYHLGIWDWQAKNQDYGKTLIKKGKFYPEKCVLTQCPNLPAGSKVCKEANGCP